MIFKKKKQKEAKAKKAEKPGIFDRKGKPALVVLIIWTILYALAFSLMFLLKLYKDEESGAFVGSRLLYAVLVFVIPIALLWLRRKFAFKIPNILNFILSIMYAGVVVVESFYMLQFAQGFSMSMLSETRFLYLNWIIYIAFFLVFYALTDSFRFSTGGVALVNLIFGFTNYYLCQFRGVGFLAVDFTNIETAANVAKDYSYAIDYPVYMLLLTSFAMVSIAFLLNHNVFFRGWKRIIPLAAGVFAVWYTYDTFVSSTYYDEVLKIKYYRPQETFQVKGMPITFLKSINDLVVEEPEGYSVEAVEEIAKQYPGTTGKETNAEKPNMIIIMDEAFTDFSQIYDVEINKDNLPFIHSHKENTISGQFFTSIFGGGTASTEFEVLTGDSMAFVPNGITAYSAYINTDMQNLTTVLEEQGYGGNLAMHPFLGNGYSRSKVYPLLGFQKFLTVDDFPANTELYGNYISDTADVKRIEEEYEKYEKTAEDDAPFYIFNVTMQNHSPFTSENVDDDIKVTTKFDYDVPELNNYENIIRATDDAVKELVTYFENTDDPTMIVFFGDHEPKLEEQYYMDMKPTYKYNDSFQKYWHHNTQFYIWTNYDIESSDDEMVSANFLSTKIMDTAGLSMSGYQQFLKDVQKDIVAITKKGYYGADGNWYHNGDETSPYYDTWNKYNIVEYNHLFDTKNTVKSFFSVPDADE